MAVIYGILPFYVEIYLQILSVGNYNYVIYSSVKLMQ